MTETPKNSLSIPPSCGILEKAMSEFKFACPVCGQHITADSGCSGSKLECPTCFRKIVIPQAPTSAENKFVLSAAEANKPRPPRRALPEHGPRSAESRKASLVVLGAVVLLILAAGALLILFRGKIFKTKARPAQLAVPAPVITNSIAWRLDLQGIEPPDAPAAGRIHGEFVTCNRNSLTGGALRFRQAIRGAPELSVTVYFFTQNPDDLRGKSLRVTTSNSLAPKVMIRWKEDGETKSQSYTNGYALAAEFGDIIGNQLPGKIYLCLPDELQTRVAGTFNAEIRKPKQP